MIAAYVMEVPWWASLSALVAFGLVATGIVLLVVWLSTGKGKDSGP